MIDDDLTKNRKLRPAMGSMRTLVLASAVLAGLASLPASAQPLSDFEPSGEFEIELAGEELEGMELFHSDRAGAYLIMAPSLKSPLMINTRTGNIEAISFMKVSKQDDGTIDLLSGASYENLGPFQRRHQSLVFNVKGEQMALKMKPDLLGNQTADGITSYNPAYAFKASKYELDAAQMAPLKSESRDVEVRVYFGSWCSVCSRLVPKLLKAEEALDGSKVQFKYYGLPRNMNDDPVSQELEIKGVPTGIVYVGGKEIGRLTGRELQKPEAAIKKVLSGA